MKKLKAVGCVIGISLVLSSALSAAVGFSTSTSAPSSDIRASFEADNTLNKTMSPRNTTDPGTTLPPRTVGQTFKPDVDATITKIVVRMGNNATLISDAGGVSHNLLIGFTKDVDGDGKTDEVIGSTYAYDLAGFQSVKDEYLILEFDGVFMEGGVFHSFELAFEAKDETHNLAIYRSDPQATDLYPDGGQLSKGNYETFPNTGLGVNAVADLTFYAIGVPGGGPPQWAGYDIDENGDVNTGAFMGWINVNHAAENWIWSYDLQIWIYLKESDVAQDGAWAYATMP